MVDPRGEIHEAAATEFDAWAAAGRGESMARGHAPNTAILLDRWRLGSESRVLDAGCGNGWAVREVLRRGAGDAVGVDLSPGMIDRARSHGAGTFQVGAADDLPFPSGHFSHLLSIESLYYYPDPERALAEWARLVRPGGQLGVLIDLYAESPVGAIWAEALDIAVHLRGEAAWADAARAAGWSNVKTLRARQPISGDFTPSRWYPDRETWDGYWREGSLILVAEIARAV